MTDNASPLPSDAQAADRTRRGPIGWVRAIPIRWRILSIAAINSAIVIVLGLLIWRGGNVLDKAWNDVRQVRQSDRILTLLESETGRLQTLIYRYVSEPSPELLAEILQLREAVRATLNTRAAKDPMLSGSVEGLVTDRFLTGFDELRALQVEIAAIYDEQIAVPAKDIAAAFTRIDDGDAEMRSILARARAAFTAVLVAANGGRLSAGALNDLEIIERAIPDMLQASDNETQREAIAQLESRTKALKIGLTRLADRLTRRTDLLRGSIDSIQGDTIVAIDSLSARMHAREEQAQATFDRTLSVISHRVLLYAAIFLVVIMIASIVIALSIRLPLQQIILAMRAIMAGDLRRSVQGTAARDEVGAMARAVETFRQNAVAKRETENELRASKERAESAFAELSAAQQNLIDAERLAALGGLVAGVAHEVNNPIGISLTVASSFARRCEMFEAELKSGAPLRRSQLDDFVRTSRDASNQLNANLTRAAELIQSFKQVAVDRSYAERRRFDLAEATDQIVASLRPVLRKSQIKVSVEVPNGLMVDGYPGSYGQILTNLFLNAATHAFADAPSGDISIVVRPRGASDIELKFADNGKGMSPDVQRQAFDPFFTTRRNEGGTGLGLHIVYTLVTQQMGGHMVLDSQVGQGTTFRIIMPRAADHASDTRNGTEEWPTKTMSSS